MTINSCWDWRQVRIKAEAATNIHCSEGGITTLLQWKVFRFELGKILDASKGWALFFEGIYEVSICKEGKAVSLHSPQECMHRQCSQGCLCGFLLV